MEENNIIEQCPICLEDISDNSYTLECNHKYHTECIVKWFRNNNNTCPLCKDVQDYSNFSYWTKIQTIQEIKKLGRRKTCPDGIKKILNKIKKEREKEKKFREHLKEFNNKYKEVLKEFRTMKTNKYKFSRNIRRYERQLLHFITISPIYIKK